MCVDTSNCSGTCGECMSDSVRRLTMANKQLTKMCDQYLAELQRARMPEELVERIRTAVEYDLQEQFGGDLVKRLIEDVLAWQAQQQQEDGK